jgi:hypothetical protein
MKKSAPKPVAKPAPKAVKAVPVPKKNKPEPKPAPASEAPTLLALNNEERLTLRLHESEAVRWAAEAHLRHGKKQAFLQKVDPQGLLGKMDDEIRAASLKAQQSKQQYEAVTRKIEERLKVKLADYSFDDETGTLVPHN